ncbi:MAG: ORC1-type DNA replication protein [Candidatus Thermoplasmatota archaeon]|nr:ORC1-type DNA replication protein [Candidatus Thermoplasmatota archaeon]
MIGSAIFEPYLEQRTIFRDKEVMRASYIPEVLPHREVEINRLASICASALRGETPSNVFIYGKTGTGKTAVTKYVGNELLKAVQELGRKIIFVYINCEIVDTEYGVLSQIGNSIIQDWNERIPFTGWPLDKVYNKLKEELEKSESITVIALDEIDKLVAKSGDSTLYILTRMNSDLGKSKTSVIGISNDPRFTELLDPRVRSSLGEEELIFPPYNASQLQDILAQRASLAFEENVLSEGALALCSALAAQEHGDARRALDMLRVAGELAERAGEQKVTEEHVRKAQAKIEHESMNELIKTLPLHSKVVLLSVILNEQVGNTKLITGEVYDTYKELVKRAKVTDLTQRRVSGLISELDMLGVINARVISKGRYGRTKEISLGVPLEEAKKVLEEDELIKELSSYRPQRQLTLV